MKSRKMKPHAKRINPARRSIQTKGKWKSIELDPSIFAEEGLEGLVCFEELTNYRLVDSEKVAARAAKELQKKEKKAQKRKAQKRKAIDVVETEGGEVSVEAKDAGESPKKKIKKKKAKLIKDESAEVAAETGQEEKLSEPVKDSTVGSQDDSEPKQAKKKKKKQKKSKKISLSELNTEKQKVQESISENKPVQANKDPKTKPAKAPKPRIKNWTSSALSGCEDTNSDMSAWKDLFVPVPVLRALSSLGFSSPTPIQALALPSAIRDRMDILGAAETGSGKTLAFAIPMIHSILEWRENHDNPDPKVDNPKPNTVKSLYLPDEPENAAPEAEEEKDLEEGDLEEGDLEEGDLEEGDLEEGDLEEGDLEEGDLEEGDLEEGDLEEGDLEEGDLEECVDPGDSDVGEDMNDGTNGSDEDGANDIKLGCVQVGEKTPFDPTPQEETVNNEGQNRPLLGLVLTPTRELAVQVKHHIDAVAKFTNITSAIVVGGMSQHKQRRLLKRRPEIVVGTPGRLWDLIKERDPHLQNLRQLRYMPV
uniref:ATP-dependent RNA helicase n=1 Tax=Knipowitschia caucasica TaxID=637954 RepID=A0AAV2JJC9_KNICA